MVVLLMDAFHRPELKSTDDLMCGFFFYVSHGCFVEQADVTRFTIICEELNKRKVDYLGWL